MRLWGKHLSNFEEKASVFNLLNKNFGINSTLAFKYCALLGISPQLKFNQLPTKMISRFDSLMFLLVRNYGLYIYKDLERLRSLYLVRYLKIGNYKALRFSQNLPMRGQRTHSNAATPQRVYPRLINSRLRNFFLARKETNTNAEKNVKRESKKKFKLGKK